MIATTIYEYVALDRQGKRRKGTARASTEVDAFRQVSAAGLTPLRLRAVRARGGGSRSVSSKAIANFTYQLGVLIEARVPLSQAIRSVAEQEPTGRFREILLTVVAKIESGCHIADALAEHEAVFGSLYIETIRAAEQSGNLVKVLEYLSEMLERDIEMRSTVRSALMYPACTICVLTVAVVFLIGFVVPRFSKMYASKQMDLPFLTKVLVSLGDSAQSYWWAYLLGVIALGLGVRAAWRSSGGRDRIERMLHVVPLVSTLMVGVSVARFARVFGLCMNSGLNMIEALRMAGNAAGRPALARDVNVIIEQVRSGGRLSAVLLVCEYLPLFAKRMLSSGEETAELGRMCGVIAKHYERETSTMAKNMSTLIEPVLIVLIAGVVLAVALGIFLPMWDMLKLMN